MNDTTPETAPVETPEAPVTEAAPAAKPKAPKKPSKPKAAKKPVAKKAAPKPKSKKKAAPKEKKPDARKVDGLRRFQVRTLKALNDSPDSLTVSMIAKRAKISHTMVVMGLGTIDAKLLKAHDRKMGFPSLLTLGHVRVAEVENTTVLQITASGKKALTSAMEAAGGKLPKVKAAAA